MSSEGPEQIVRMANDIGNFFRAETDRQMALDGIANHINKYWTRRMRQRLLEYAQQGGNELDELPLAAVARVTVSAGAATAASVASAPAVPTDAAAPSAPAK
jgi:formate dehydrogenase subunit delta